MASEKKIRKQTLESVVPYIPEEIIVNILTRSTVKALSRCMCVSKSWLSMISSPEFIESHRQSPSAQLNVILFYSVESHRLSLYTCSLDHYMVKYRSLYQSFIKRESLIKLEFSFDLMEETPRCLVVVGSSNGLCCIVTENGTLVLLNPSTRKWKQIPKLVYDGIDCTIDMTCMTFVFVYDDFGHDYKIVHYQPWPIKKLVISIYSLRANTWSEIETDDFAPVKRQGRPQFLNGKLHWLAKPRGEGFWIILSYDLKTGSIGQLLHPCNGCVWTFGVFKGYLCLEDDSDVWIMSEYGVDESWMTVESYCSEEREFRWDLEMFSSFEMESDGTLDSVFHYQHNYNRTNGNFNDFEPVVYIESLVPPTLGGDDTSLPVVQGELKVDKARATRNRRPNEERSLPVVQEERVSSKREIGKSKATRATGSSKRGVGKAQATTATGNRRMSARNRKQPTRLADYKL